MIRWVVWFFAVLPVFVLDGWLVRVLWPVPALTLAVGLFLGLSARLAALPGLLLCAALARSVLVPGDAALHVLVLGIPVAVLVPLRAVFSRRHLLWQGAAAGFLALSVPAVTNFMGRFVATAPVPVATGWEQILWAAVLAPPSAWLLSRVPPLSGFVEPGE